MSQAPNERLELDPNSTTDEVVQKYLGQLSQPEDDTVVLEDLDDSYDEGDFDELDNELDPESLAEYQHGVKMGFYNS